MRHLFPLVVSYNRFVELEKEVAVPLALFIKKVLLGKCTGISFVDSTPLRVCRNQRIHVHKVFKGIAQRGKCSMGWFFGFKLHLICNEKGELLNFMITPGDVDDRKPLEYKAFIDFIYGKLVADKGYISKNLFQRLFVDGIQLITKLKSNMKGALMSVSDRLLLRKRAIIETVNDELENIAQVEHSRHRSFDNFIVNIYRQRWEIELLFKQIKQNFPLRYFYGESRNAIKIQIWVTLIANLLLMVIQSRLSRNWSFSGLTTMVRLTLMYYVDLYSLLNQPERD